MSEKGGSDIERLWNSNYLNVLIFNRFWVNLEIHNSVCHILYVASRCKWHTVCRIRFFPTLTSDWLPTTLKISTVRLIKKTHPVVDGVSLNLGTLGTLRATFAKAPRGTALVTSCFRGKHVPSYTWLCQSLNQALPGTAHAFLAYFRSDFLSDLDFGIFVERCIFSPREFLSIFSSLVQRW